MKLFTLFIAVFAFSSITTASDLKTVDNLNDVIKSYGLDSSQLLQINQINAADVDKGIVDGPRNIVSVPNQAETFVLYGSRIVYIRGRTLTQVGTAFSTASSLPPPPPMGAVWGQRTETVDANHQILWFGFNASQSKFHISMTVNCNAATHDVNVQANQKLVQNKWIGCVDASDSSKLWYPAGWQNNMVVQLSEGVIGVLIQNVVVIHRNKIGIYTPSTSDMLSLGEDASEQTFKFYMKRLGLASMTSAWSCEEMM